MPRRDDDMVKKGHDPWQRGRGERIHKVLMFVEQRRKCKMHEIRGHFSYQKTEEGYVSWDPDTTEKYVYELQDAGLVLITDDETVIYLEQPKEQQKLGGSPSSNKNELSTL